MNHLAFNLEPHYAPSVSYGIASGPSNSWKLDGHASHRVASPRGQMAQKNPHDTHTDTRTHDISLARYLASEALDGTSHLVYLAVKGESRKARAPCEFVYLKTTTPVWC